MSPRVEVPTAARLRVLIVDDEAFARQRLNRLLADEPGVEIVGEAEGGAEAVEIARRERPDVLFLDVQMPEVNGFDVVRELGADASAGAATSVVFVTAYDEHALEAFDVRALDYLLKPVDAERLHLAVERARAQHAQADAAERLRRLRRLVDLGMSPRAGTLPDADADASDDLVAPPSVPAERGAHPTRLLVKHGGRMFFVRTEEVDWIESYGNYVRLHVGPRTHLLRSTMGALEQALDPAQFARIHRSTIVNLDRVKEIQPWFSGDYVVLLTDGGKLKLSRAYRAQVEARGLVR